MLLLGVGAMFVLKRAVGPQWMHREDILLGFAAVVAGENLATAVCE